LFQKLLTIDEKYLRYYDKCNDRYQKLADKFEEQKSGIYAITCSEPDPLTPEK